MEKKNSKISRNKAIKKVDSQGVKKEDFREVNKEEKPDFGGVKENLIFMGNGGV